MRYIVWFEEYTADDHDRVGGKSASLGEMIAAGLPVPPGFAITTDAYATLRQQTEMRTLANKKLAAADLNDPVGLRETSRQIRELIEGVTMDADVRSQVIASYLELSERCGVEDVPVAVRSSATAEDLPDASFAGQQDTYLWVTGAEEVADAVQRCWSSIFTDRAISYRHETGHDHELISMAVAVQKMVQPKSAGVAFTLNPSDGDRSQIAIDSSWGFGEGVVSGEVTPDNFLVDKVLFEIVRRTISPKSMEYALDATGSGVEKVEVEPERAMATSLTDEEVRAIAHLARLSERHYGSPQDVEWAVDLHLPEGENIVLLQSRPETVWSRKKRRTVASGASFMESIVSTLVSPVHSRDRQSTIAEGE